MTGFIKITVSEVDKEFLEGHREACGADIAARAAVESEVSLQNVDILDKFILLQTLMRAIDLSENDLKMFIITQRLGILEKEVI